jgi:hypothetical protein
MPSSLFFRLLCSLFLFFACAKPRETSVLLIDFEGDAKVPIWPGKIFQWPAKHVHDSSATAALSTQWKANGLQSLKIDPGIGAGIEQLPLSDWKIYQVLRLQVNNLFSQPVRMGLNLRAPRGHLAARAAGVCPPARNPNRGN